MGTMGILRRRHLKLIRSQEYQRPLPLLRGLEKGLEGSCEGINKESQETSGNR